jgi:two-component system, sensor histidine kinase
MMNSLLVITGIFCAGICILLGVVAVRYKRRTDHLTREVSRMAAENELLVDEIERIKNEVHLLRLKAGESDRLKSVFLYNMSHELRTPLNAIMGFSGLIANPSIPDTEKINYANIINRNIDSLLEIINDIFDISEFESGGVKLASDAVNVNELINSLQTWVNIEKTSSGKDDIFVKTHKASKGNNFSIETDAYKLRRALSHLVYNALKYSEKGFIEIGYSIEEAGSVNFFVKDEGIGFSKDKLDLIFSQFRQVDETPVRQFGGLGLGLTLAQKYTTILNGRLWAESTPGIGSTFYISVPCKFIETS